MIPATGSLRQPILSRDRYCTRLSGARRDEVAVSPSVTLPGIGIAVQPLDGGSSGADASATDVTRNEIAETSFSVLLGNSEHARVWQNVDRLTG